MAVSWLPFAWCGGFVWICVPMGYFWRDGLLFAVVLRRLVVRVVGICL